MRDQRSEEHTSELQSPKDLVCRLLLEKKKHTQTHRHKHTHKNTPTHTQTHTLTNILHLFYSIRVYVKVRICTISPGFFFFNDTATTEIYTLSLHDALPISVAPRRLRLVLAAEHRERRHSAHRRSEEHTSELQSPKALVCRLLLEKKKNKHFLFKERKSTRLISRHSSKSRMR